MGRKRNGQKLTALEARFVANVQKGMKQQDAAIAAGYSARTAKSKSSQLMKKAEVREALETSTQAALRIATVDAGEVIKGLSHIAFADIRKVFKVDGSFVMPKDLPEDMARAIIAVRRGVDKNGHSWIEYKFESRIKALEVMASIGKLAEKDPAGETAKAFTDLIKTAAKLGRESAKSSPRPVVVDAK